MRMKEWQEINIDSEKPSAERLVGRPCRSSFRAQAGVKNDIDSPPLCLDGIKHGLELTRDGDVTGQSAPSSRASVATWGLALSFRYVMARSAPALRKCSAADQAKLFSFATPTTSAFRPLRSMTSFEAPFGAECVIQQAPSQSRHCRCFVFTLALAPDAVTILVVAAAVA